MDSVNASTTGWGGLALVYMKLGAREAHFRAPVNRVVAPHRTLRAHVTRTRCARPESGDRLQDRGGSAKWEYRSSLSWIDPRLGLDCDWNRSGRSRSRRRRNADAPRAEAGKSSRTALPPVARFRGLNTVPLMGPRTGPPNPSLVLELRFHGPNRDRTHWQNGPRKDPPHSLGGTHRLVSR